MDRNQYVSAGSPSDQAIEWLARLRADDVTAAETADFATWLATSSLHKIAFDEATDLWQLLAQMPQQSVPQPSKARRAYRRALPLAAAASVLLACFILVLQLTTPTFTTGKGEQRRVVLTDDSIAFLNTSSEIHVDYSRDARRIKVIRGEVWFDVAKNPHRPFIVTGLYASATAIGTAFTVRETPGFTRVSVTEGTVAVSVSEREHHQLQEGQQSTVSAAVTDFQPYQASTALAWRRGQLIYNDVRLDELLADLSRYLPKKMVLSGRISSDNSLLDNHVSAVLFLDDQGAMLEALSKSLPIQWQDVSDKLIIISPNI